MAWILLGIAGGLEMVWATTMKLSEGFTKPLWAVVTVAAMGASVVLLAQAIKTLPMGTAVFCGPAAHRHRRPESYEPLSQKKRPKRRKFLVNCPM